MSTVSGPYKVTAQDLETHKTLTRKDMDRWYVMVNGSMQFARDEYHARGLIMLLREDDRRNPTPPALSYD